MSKISGPPLDRIDIHIEVPVVKYAELSSKRLGEQSSAVRTRVKKARELQRERFAGRKGLFKNADMQSKEIREFCQVDKAGEDLFEAGDHEAWSECAGVRQEPESWENNC